MPLNLCFYALVKAKQRCLLITKQLFKEEKDLALVLCGMKTVLLPALGDTRLFQQGESLESSEDTA